MIIYLYGEDSYRRSQKLKELIGAYRGKHKNIDLLIVDFEDNPEDWIKVRDFLSQPSMFVDSKLTIIKESNIPDSKEWVKTLKTEIKTPKNFLIISDKNPPKKDFQFLLEEPVKHQKFNELKGVSLEMFLKKEALARHLNFSFPAWRFFHSYIDSQPEKSWFAINELEKIKLANFNQPIALKDLQTIVDWAQKEKLFLLAQKILYSKNLKQKMGFLEQALSNESPSYIFNSLAYQAYGEDAVKLADYDIAIKSGKLDYEEAILDFTLY